MKLQALLKAALILWDENLGVGVQVDGDTVRVASTDRYMLVVGSTGTPWDDTATTTVLRDKKDVEDVLRFVTRHFDATVTTTATDLTMSGNGGRYRLTVPVYEGAPYPKVGALLPTTTETPVDPEFVVDPKRLAQAAKIALLLTDDRPIVVTPRGRKPALITDRGGDWSMLVMPIKE